jgi:ssDNA-binding replication factor A large subunit
MGDENYENVLGKISRISGVDKEELDRKVEAKRAKLAGLISKDGALQVIAAELGINFDNEKVKIDELLPGMRKVNTIGKVIGISPVRCFTRNGKEGKVCNFLIADDTSNIKVVLWDTNHIDLIETGTITEGCVVEIKNGGMRDNELHLGGFSEFKKSNEVLEQVKTEKIVKQKKIFDFRVGDNVSSRAFIMQVFEPKFFYVCPECKKKAQQDGESFNCAEHGKIIPEKRALINLVLDDGTESVRAVVFNENLKQLGLTELENKNLLEQQKENLIGKEMIFSGVVRNNSFFNTPEFTIDSIKEIDLNELVMQLEKN